MKRGTIYCSCGKAFWCETVNDTIVCMDCGAINVLPEASEDLPVPVIQPEQAGQ